MSSKLTFHFSQFPFNRFQCFSIDLAFYLGLTEARSWVGLATGEGRWWFRSRRSPLPCWWPLWSWPTPWSLAAWCFWCFVSDLVKKVAPLESLEWGKVPMIAKVYEGLIWHSVILALVCTFHLPKFLGSKTLHKVKSTSCIDVEQDQLIGEKPPLSSVGHLPR